MKNILFKLIIYSPLIFCVACKEKIDFSKEEMMIREMLATERKAHFERNADLFINEFADSMISVNRGIVNIPERSEQWERIGNYFSKMEFIKWDDTAEPVIEMSPDGKMAFAVIQKKVVVTFPDSTGNKVIDSTDYAWVSIYRKINSEWKVVCNVSTNK